MTKIRKTHMCHQSSQHIKDRIKLTKKRNEYYLNKIQRIEELDRIYRQAVREYEENYPRLAAAVGANALSEEELQLKEQKLRHQLEQLREIEFEKEKLYLEMKRNIDNAFM